MLPRSLLEFFSVFNIFVQYSPQAKSCRVFSKPIGAFFHEHRKLDFVFSAFMSKIMVTLWSKRAFCYKTKRNTGTHSSSNFMENSCLAKPGAGDVVENGGIFCYLLMSKEVQIGSILVNISWNRLLSPNFLWRIHATFWQFSYPANTKARIPPYFAHFIDIMLWRRRDLNTWRSRYETDA